LVFLDDAEDVDLNILSHLAEAARADLSTAHVSESEQFRNQFNFNEETNIQWQLAHTTWHRVVARKLFGQKSGDERTEASKIRRG
jgi:hypothetical protein